MLKTVGNPSTRYGDQTILDGNIVIGTSGKGIDFSAGGNAPGMTSELLDDYEEGTWTPALTYSTPGTSSFTYATRNGFYTKVGDLVVCTFYIQLSAFDKGTATGALRLRDLPFVAAATDTPIGAGWVQNWTFGGYPLTRIIPSTSTANLQRLVSGGAVASLNDPSATSEIGATVIYRV